VYSTYLGGPYNDIATGIANNNTSNAAYIVGQTYSSAFSSSGTKLTYPKAFVTSLSATGTAGPLATQIFGGAGVSYASDIVVNQTNNNIWITGYTTSPNFPVLDPIQATKAGQYDAFLVEMAQKGKWQFATYWGGTLTDEALAIGLDSSGNVYIAGTTNSTNFPTLNPLQSANAGGYDAFITQFVVPTTGAPTVGFSTYLGGSGTDVITAMSIGSANKPTVVGYTSSPNFPVTSGVIQSTLNGKTNTFAARIQFQ